VTSRNRRRGLRTGRRDWLWAVAFCALALAGIAGAFAILSGGSSSSPSGDVIATVDGVECQRNEQLHYHVHAFLAVIIDGQPVEVPSSIGIRPDCYFWLHTHSPDGLLHIEAPEKRDFTLGQFFAVWGQSISATQVLGRTTDATHEIKTTINGEPWVGDPADIPLNDKTDIVIQYGPPFVPPPQHGW